MRTFLIELEYESKRYECFVQKLVCFTEDLYILNLKDSGLIKKFMGKKMVFYSNRSLQGIINRGCQVSYSRDSLFEERAWGAIWRKENGILL